VNKNFKIKKMKFYNNLYINKYCIRNIFFQIIDIGNIGLNIKLILDNIKGIGPATRNKLLKHFGSIKGVKNASLEELTQLIGKKTAENIKNNLDK